MDVEDFSQNQRHSSLPNPSVVKANLSKQQPGSQEARPWRNQRLCGDMKPVKKNNGCQVVNEYQGLTSVSSPAAATHCLLPQPWGLETHALPAGPAEAPGGPWSLPLLPGVLDSSSF